MEVGSLLPPELTIRPPPLQAPDAVGVFTIVVIIVVIVVAVLVIVVVIAVIAPDSWGSPSWGHRTKRKSTAKRGVIIVE